MLVHQLRGKRGTKIYAECDDGSEFLTFDKMDGSWAHLTSEKGAQGMLKATQKLEKHKDGFKLSTK